MPRFNPAMHDSGSSSIGMALLFGSIAFTTAALASRAYLTGDLRAVHSAYSSSKSSALDLGDFTSLFTLLYQMTVLGVILLYAYVAEYHPPFPHAEKSYDRDEFMFLTVLLFVAAAFTVKKNDQTAAMQDRDKKSSSSSSNSNNPANQNNHTSSGASVSSGKTSHSNSRNSKHHDVSESDVTDGEGSDKMEDINLSEDESRHHHHPHHHNSNYYRSKAHHNHTSSNRSVSSAGSKGSKDSRNSRNSRNSRTSRRSTSSRRTHASSATHKSGTVAPVKASCDLVNRDQTEEWKGWMQYLFLLYHYVHAEEVYNSIRVMITCYVWMTGFGNFSFFYIKGDYSFVRLIQMLWRLNFLVCFLCLTQGTTYLLYYICPLHTYYFGMVYLTMSIGRGWNYSKYGLRCKLFLVALGIFLLWDVDTGLFQLVHGPFLGTEPQLGGGSGAMWEWYFRSGLDHWSTFFGMVFAANFPITSLFMRKLEAQSMPKQYLAKGAMSIVMVVAFAAWVTGPFLQPKKAYNATHCFYGLIPLTVYIYFRNVTPKLRSYHLGLLEQIGKTTLETYLMQHHVWLTSDAKTLLTLIPGWPKVNMMVVTLLYYLVSRRLYKLTLFLRGMILPNDTRKCLRYGSAMVLIVVVFWAMGYSLQSMGMVSITTVGIVCALCGMLMYQTVLDLSWKGYKDSALQQATEERTALQNGNTNGTTTEGSHPGRNEETSEALTGISTSTSTSSSSLPKTKLNHDTFVSRLSPPIIGTMVLFVLSLLWNSVTNLGATKFPTPLPPTCEAAVNDGMWVPLDGCNEYQRGVAYRNDGVSSFASCTGSYVWGWKAAPSKSNCRFYHRTERQIKHELERRHVMFVGDSMVRNVFHAFRRAMGDLEAGMYDGTGAGKHADMSYTYNDGGTVVDFVWAPLAVDQLQQMKDLRAKVLGSGGASEDYSADGGANDAGASEKQRPDMVVFGGGSWDQLHVFSTDEDQKSLKATLLELAKEMKGARDAQAVPIVWLNPTSINTPALQQEDKRLYMKEDNMKEMRDLYAQLGVWAASSFVLDGTAFTKDRVEESFDGVHYPFHVYDAGAQILANAMDWVLEDIDELNDFVPPQPGILANPGMGVIMLIAAAVGLFFFDGFFGVSYVASLFVKGVVPSQLYEEAFTALHRAMKLPALSGDSGEGNAEGGGGSGGNVVGGLGTIFGAPGSGGGGGGKGSSRHSPHRSRDEEDMRVLLPSRSRERDLEMMPSRYR